MQKKAWKGGGYDHVETAAAVDSFVLPLSPLPHPQASDNHIGYMEKDPVRCNDSLETFEEVLRTARDQEVPQWLLATVLALQWGNRNSPLPN